MHVLLVGDFVKHTGFGRVNEAIARGLKALGHTVSVLAVRYAGDPTPLQADFVGFECPDHFVVGYGMDVGHAFRELPFVGIVAGDA